jgi:hypothetical protein
MDGCFNLMAIPKFARLWIFFQIEQSGLIFDFKLKVLCEVCESSKFVFHLKSLHFSFVFLSLFWVQLLFEVCYSFNSWIFLHFLFQTFMVPLKSHAKFGYKAITNYWLLTFPPKPFFSSYFCSPCIFSCLFCYYWCWS